jgi:hypothetical protein
METSILLGRHGKRHVAALEPLKRLKITTINGF